MRAPRALKFAFSFASFVQRMEIVSLGYRTDFLFHRANGIVADRGDYLVVRTPASPTFYWGNFLFFAAPPARDDALGWERIFLTEIERLQPESCHRAYGWNGAQPDPSTMHGFTASGFELIASLTLTARDIYPPPRTNPAVAIRPLGSDADYECAIALHVECRDPLFSEADYRVFKEREFDAYRRFPRRASGRGAGTIR